jgi:hypothetical protein
VFGTGEASRAARRSGRSLWWLLAAAAPLALLAWQVLAPTATTPPPARLAAAPHASAPPASAAAASTPRGPYSLAGLRAREAQRVLWQRRLERAQQTLDAYREATRYPPTSQPLTARRDQAYPNQWISEDRVLDDASGRGAPHLQTTQERVFVQGSESVRFTLSLRDEAGRVLPLRVLHASAREITPPDRGSLYPEVPVSFSDDGANGDAAPGDGIFGAELRPATHGFAGLSGQIRVEARLQYADRETSTSFDIVYTGEPPATWQGGVREAMEDGSLAFYLKAQVREGGRYVVAARVDDANGQPFALLGFNDELAPGAQEVRLALFGKLVRDVEPAFPLRLRDVDAFLLRPDAFPDRGLMPRLAGPVYVSRSHPLADFSGAEWNAEERTRYLNELSRDVGDAQRQLDRLSAGR